MPSHQSTKGQRRSRKPAAPFTPSTRSSGGLSSSLSSLGHSVVHQTLGSSTTYTPYRSMSESVSKSLMKLSRFLPLAEGDPGAHVKAKSKDATSDSGESDEVEREHEDWSQQVEKAQKDAALAEWEHLEVDSAGMATVRTVRSDAPKGIVFDESVVKGVPGGLVKKGECKQ